MARTQTMVQLSDALLELLDAEAERRGCSRSAVIRDAVSEQLEDLREASLAAAIVAGYERTPPATPDEWGSPEALGERSSVELLQRLDAEEEREGAERW